MKDVDTTTIIDSGAQINCIDWTFMQRNHIPTKLLKHSFPIQNTDQTSNIICQYEVVVYVQLRSVTQKVCFYVINGGKENAMLGHPWLEAVNPIINWKKGTVTIPPTKDKSLALSFSHLAEHASYLSKNTRPAATSTINHERKLPWTQLSKQVSADTSRPSSLNTSQNGQSTPLSSIVFKDAGPVLSPPSLLLPSTN